MPLVPAARIGDAVARIDTPALVVDLDALEHNLDAMAAYARRQGLRLRPHAKMHKSVAVAQAQIARGAVGLCVQKLTEAEALAAGGITDLYISNQVVDEGKLARVAALAARVQLAIAVDSPLGITRLAAACAAAGSRVQVFVEIDAGQGRCGVPPAEAVALAAQVLRAGLPFAGLQAYHGGAQHLRGAAERSAAIADAAQRVRVAQASLAAAGLGCPLVTGGGTGSFTEEAASGLWGELQCGSYAFMDRDYADNTPDGAAPRFRHALFVKSQVISRQATHAVVDAGHKAHAIDSGPPRVWQQGWRFRNGGDEHGIVLPGEAGTAPLPGLGETVWLVPGHCDPTVNLHDHLVAVRGGLLAGRVEALWPVDARGALR